MTRAEHIRELMNEYGKRRADNRAQADRRGEEAVRLDPNIADIRQRASYIAMNAMRALINAETREEKIAIAENMRREGLENNAELRVHLRKIGLPEDYLDERYVCEKCRDTGYTDDMPAKFCECFERELRLRQFEDGTMAGLDSQNFDSFIMDGRDEKAVMARDYCYNYAMSYPNTEKQNILFTGPGGVGKTFLLNCVFAKIVERGKSGVRITAYRMLEAMREKHIGTGNDESFEELISAPILLIDDLGTEPMLRNITVEYLFTLLNERCAQNRHTIIATNLSPEKIKERYGERVSSRILDKSRCVTISLSGKDLRRA